MKRMDDKEFFGATGGRPLFKAPHPDSWDACNSPEKISPPASDVSPELVISGSMNVAAVRRTASLSKVTDAALREVMEDVLAEDADLIAYLRGR